MIKLVKTQLSVMQVNGPDISKYGVIVSDKRSGLVTGLIEKPKFENAPSNLASIGRYVITNDIIDILKNQPIGVAGEIQLADSIHVQAVNNMVDAVLLNGKRFDCGNVEGYIKSYQKCVCKIWFTLKIKFLFTKLFISF